MTNAPDRMELVVLPDDVDKVVETRETKLSDGNPVSVFRFNCEDHTLGNILRLKLLENEQVLFAGYRVEHPLDRHMKVRVQTVAEITPRDAVESALLDLEKQFKSFQDNLKLSHGSAAAANL
jgi:DNA-directed RNA polymerase II subunit RPB11